MHLLVSAAAQPDMCVTPNMSQGKEPQHVRTQTARISPQQTMLMPCTAVVTVGGALRCATLSGNPFTFQFQVLWFLHLLTIPALLAVVLLMLVILPMHDAYAINEVRLEQEACGVPWRCSWPKSPERDSY